MYNWTHSIQARPRWRSVKICEICLNVISYSNIFRTKHIYEEIIFIFEWAYFEANSSYTETFLKSYLKVKMVLDARENVWLEFGFTIQIKLQRNTLTNRCILSLSRQYACLIHTNLWVCSMHVSCTRIFKYAVCIFDACLYLRMYIWHTYLWVCSVHTLIFENAYLMHTYIWKCIFDAHITYLWASVFDAHVSLSMYIGCITYLWECIFNTHISFSMHDENNDYKINDSSF